MMGRMAGLVEALQGRRLFTEFPPADRLPSWVAAAEVLIQEGIRAWAFPAGDGGRVDEALRLYGRRARIGVYGVRTPDELREAAARGVHFVTSPITTPELVAAAGGLVPFAPGALTPNEIHYALGVGAECVQLIPTEVLGMAYGRALGALFADVELIATGRLERFQCDMSLDSCARVVGLQSGVLFPDAAAPAASVNLDALRRRAQEYGGIG